MKIVIVGGGVIGVTSAWYLARAGHAVTVVERQAQVARETGFSNGGQVSWGSGNPWAAPGMPAKALAWLFKRHAPLILRPRLDPALWSWLLRMLRECTPERYRINKERQFRLARYSHACLVALRQELGIEYRQSQHGILVLYRHTRDLDDAGRERRMMEAFGVPVRALDRAGCVAHEPALAAAAGRIAGGLLYPADESGDCRLFTEQLAERARAAGVEIRTGHTLASLVAAGDRIERIETDHGTLRADGYVLAGGVASLRFLQRLGVALPLYPVKGYSITVPIVNAAAAPRGSLTDETYKVVMTRLGEVLRAAGIAELAGYDLNIRASRIATLKHVVHDWFPQAGDLARAEPWAGLRPMTPDNPPVIGATPYRNLFLNTGHGTLGWTMACGSGKLLADIVSGRTPEIDTDGLTLARFRSG